MNQKGVTLIELLMAIVIGSIAFFPLAIPLVGERSFWGAGQRQTEAQRDAQMALRAMARVARECSAYNVLNPGPNAGQLSLINSSGPPDPFAGPNCFLGGPAAPYNGLFLQRKSCDNFASTVVLIDGVRSQVQGFTITQVVPNKLVRVQLQVTHRLRTSDPVTRNETLVTELFLRNAP